jgi:hypothetical protein
MPGRLSAGFLFKEFFRSLSQVLEQYPFVPGEAEIQGKNARFLLPQEWGGYTTETGDETLAPAIRTLLLVLRQ